MRKMIAYCGLDCEKSPMGQNEKSAVFRDTP